MNQPKNKRTLFYSNICELKSNPRNSRIHSEEQIHEIARSIEQFGFNNPILIDKNNVIIAGHGRYAAAKQLSIEKIPTIKLEDLTKEEVRAYIIADNRLAEKAGWDNEILKIEFQELINLGFDISLTGFSLPEIDIVINDEVINSQSTENLDKIPKPNKIKKRVKKHDLWQLGAHLLYCGDSTKEESFKTLLDNELAHCIFSDPPYNVKIQGHVTKNKSHNEFEFASGEMSKIEFTEFLTKVFELECKYSVDGSIHYQCMDWRHLQEILAAGDKIYSELKNICVWDKVHPSNGSLYRSQHELVLVFKNGTAPHRNNIELGKYGRYRTNIWKVKGMSVCNPQSKVLRDYHPTVKPVSLIMDALLDCSAPSDIILDCFGGSGSVLIAAEKTQRKARLIEIDPNYCDVILHRWENITNKNAILQKGGEE